MLHEGGNLATPIRDPEQVRLGREMGAWALAILGLFAALLFASVYFAF
jgi:hypothetical protein